MQTAVGIVIRVFQKLFLGEAGHGVGGQQGHRLGVHIGVICLIGEIEEQRLGRILFRAVQRGVLEHVGQAGVVYGSGEKGQVIHPVDIVVGDVHQLGARAIVLEQHHRRARDGKLTDGLDRKTGHGVAHGWDPRVIGFFRRFFRNVRLGNVRLFRLLLRLFCGLVLAAGCQREQQGKDKNESQDLFHGTGPSFAYAAYSRILLLL